MEKRREQKLKRSSRDGPSRSMTSTLYCFSWPYHLQCTTHPGYQQFKHVGRGRHGGSTLLNEDIFISLGHKLYICELFKFIKSDCMLLHSL